jgi:hypothetical protein
MEIAEDLSPHLLRESEIDDNTAEMKSMELILGILFIVALLALPLLLVCICLKCCCFRALKTKESGSYNIPNMSEQT